MTDLAHAFLRRADEAITGRLPESAALERALAGAVAEARAPWPQVTLADETFAGHLAVCWPPDAGDVREALARLRLADLYLACACAHGDPAALAAFEAGYLSVVGPALGKMRLGDATIEEVRQLVRQRLLVAEPGETPRVADYAGRGDLRNWVRATAVRTALNHLRKHRREIPTEDDRLMSVLPDAADDPELAHMKNLYSAEFKASFAEGLTMLGAREQTLLRMYYVDELTIDGIGAVYRVHRVTAFRWVTRAREALVEHVHAAMRTRLQVSPTELDSIMRLIRSRVDLSLARHLDDD